MSWIMHNKLVFFAAIVIIVGGVWYGLSQSAAPAPLLTTTAADGSAATQANDQEIIGTLLALRAVTLSGTVFSDPAFLTLDDHGTPIVPEPVGRQNPFAPLGVQQQTASAALTPPAATR